MTVDFRRKENGPPLMDINALVLVVQRPTVSATPGRWEWSGWRIVLHECTAAVGLYRGEFPNGPEIGGA